jgi:hypothetical protein
MSSRIEVFEKSHRYKLDGEFVPSVTTIVGDVLRKPSLERWNAKTVAEFVAAALAVDGRELSHDAAPLVDAIERAARQQRKTIKRTSEHELRGSIGYVLSDVPRFERDEAARRGTEVHELASRIAVGEEVDVPGEIVPAVDSMLEWLRDWNPRIEFVECAVANDALLYAGRFDLIVTFPDGRRWLLDWKTGRSGIYPEVALQLCGYEHCTIMRTPDGDGDVEMPKVDACGAVWLGPFGYRFYEVTTGPSVWAMFQRVKRDYHYLKANHPSGKDETGNWAESPLLRELGPLDRAAFAS